MAITLYESAVPLTTRLLRNLIGILDKAEAHAEAEGRPASDYIEARLAPDMYPLGKQVGQVSDGVKGCLARLAAVPIPTYDDPSDTFDGLRSRLAKTLAFIEALPADQINGGDDMRIVQLVLPSRTLTFHARDYLLGMMLPNLTFHTTTAYGILRHLGVPLGKMDYIAGLPLVE